MTPPPSRALHQHGSTGEEAEETIVSHHGEDGPLSAVRGIWWELDGTLIARVWEGTW